LGYQHQLSEIIEFSLYLQKLTDWPGYGVRGHGDNVGVLDSGKSQDPQQHA